MEDKGHETRLDSLKQGREDGCKDLKQEEKDEKRKKCRDKNMEGWKG